MKYGIGDWVRVNSNDGAPSHIVGKNFRITNVDEQEWKYAYSLADTGVDENFCEDELDPVSKKVTRGSKMAKKCYKVIQNTPAWNKGAIVAQDENGDYEAIESLWDAVEDNEDYSETPKVVENNPDFFERVYEMSKGKKAVYVTKEKAREMASKFYETE